MTHRNHAHVVLTISFLLLVPSAALPQPKAFAIEKEIRGDSLGTYMEVLEDTSGRLTIDDVTGSTLFSPPERESANYGYSSYVYWVRLSVLNPLPTEAEWLLQVNYPLIDQVDLYIPDPSGRFTVKKAGDHLPFDAREIRHQSFVFLLQENPHSKRTYYLRFQTTGTLNLALTAWSTTGFVEFANKEKILLGLYYGTILALTIYNFFLFLSIRDKSYLYYVLFHLVQVIFLLILNGLAFQYFWPNWVWWANISVNFFAFFSSLWASQVTRSFLNTAQVTRFLDRILTLIVWTGALGVVSSVVMDYTTGNRLAISLALVTAIVVEITALTSLAKGYRPARYFLIAWTGYLAGVLLWILKTSSVLPENLLTSYFLQIGSAMEVILLSLGLGDRINIMKREKEIAQQEAMEHLGRMDKLKDELNRKLEAKILERTFHLQEALKQLEGTQKSLAESEKKTALAQLSAGIAYELNDPVNHVSRRLPDLKSKVQEVEWMLRGLFDSSDVEEEDATELKSFFEKQILESNVILKDLETGVERAAIVVDELRGMTGVTGAVLEKIDLKHLVRTEFALARRNQEKPGKRIKESLSISGDPMVEANPHLLSRSFRNIFENACFYALYSPDPEVRIEVGSNDGNTVYLVSVSNNGPSIGPDEESRVFDMFFTTREVGLGRGTGLSLTRSLMENQGGQVSLSDNGRLSGWVTFTVRIPARPYPEPDLGIQARVPEESL